MSLIHEALKKVEHQRQLGKAPSLSSPAFRRRRWSRWPWLLLLVLVVAGAFGWRWYQQPAMDQAPQVAPVTQPQQATESTSQVKAGLGTAKPTQTGSRLNPSGPVMENKPANPAIAGHSAKLSVKAPGPGKTAAPAMPAMVALHKPGKADKPDISSTPAGATKADKASSIPATGNPGLAPAKPAPAQNKLPMYWQLSYAERKDLPAFKISMHMYSDKPMDRFIILNGTRQVEGDTLPDDMKLIAINPVSITVEMNGKRFLVPRQGSN